MNQPAVDQYVDNLKSCPPSTDVENDNQELMAIINRQLPLIIAAVKECDSTQRSLKWESIVTEWTDDVQYVCQSDTLEPFGGTATGRNDVRKKIEQNFLALEDQRPEVLKAPEIGSNSVTLHIREEGVLRATQERYVITGSQSFEFKENRISRMELLIQSHETIN